MNIPKRTLLQQTITLMGVVLGMVLVSCQDRVEITREYTVFEPVYLSLAEIREGVDVVAPRPIQERGRIYLYQHWILINEPGNGIHIIDNSVPQSPAARQFITLPGNFNFSVRNDLLYADSYIDLVILDISNIDDIREVNRMEAIFQDLDDIYTMNLDSGLVIDYEPVRRVTVTQEDVGGHFEDVFVGGFFGFREDAMVAVDQSDFSSPQGATGIGGSMAMYTIVNDYLYVLDNSNLVTFDISDATNPTKTNELLLGWDIETLFPSGNNLFVGAQSGMYIIDNSTQSSPELMSVYSHIVSCDPVVVQGDRAYVTLRSGNNCFGTLNQLEVINISDLRNPRMIKTYPMTSPHGLGIDGSTLFICEGESGLKIFDAADELAISNNMIMYVNDIDAYDVIPYQNTLYLIGHDGLYQYDYSSPDDIKLISKLEIGGSEL